MNFSLIALAFTAVVVNSVHLGNDVSSEAYIKNYIDENQAELYETILRNFISEHRRQLSRKQLEGALNKIDQLEPYYVTLRIYRSLCSIYKNGESITNISDEEFKLILDEASDFPQILTDLEQNWEFHAEQAEEACVEQGAIRHEEEVKTVETVDDDVVFPSNDPVTDDPTDYDSTSDSTSDSGTNEGFDTTFVDPTTTSGVTEEEFTDTEVTDEVIIDDDSSVEIIDDNMNDVVDSETEKDNDSDFIVIDASGSGSSSGSGSGSGSGAGSGSGGSGDDEPIVASAKVFGFTALAVMLSIIV